MSTYRLAGRMPALMVAGLASAALAIAGCGGSKPAYCSAQKDLKSAVEGLTNVSNVNELKTSLQKIESTAKSITDSVKNGFPSETAALKSSLSALEATLKEAPSNPQAAAKKLPSEVSAVGTAINNFANATKSKCS